MNKKQQAAIAKVEHYRADLAETEKRATTARKHLHAWVGKAVAAGVPSATVARAAGLSRARVSQISPLDPVTETPIHAQQETPEPSCVTDTDTVRSLPGTDADTLSGIVSRRRRDRYGRTTVCIDTRVTSDLALILDHARSVSATRVILTGPTPLDTSTGATRAEAVRAWALAPVVGWTAGSHYLADPDLPVLRFTAADDPGVKVALVRGASWWGETDASAEVCSAAWAGLEQRLNQVAAFQGAGLADTPATTGRALWLRSIPEGREFPVLGAEYRELIHATSGQGRIERLDAPAGGHPDGFTVMDGRFMYAALTWGMPVGEPQRWTGSQVRALEPREYERLMRGRGRWKITATVPDAWQHVGLLMAPGDAKRWTYPRRPGETFTTWADGSEVWLALTNGWAITTHEGISWQEGKPLDSWRDALLAVWGEASAAGTEPAALAAKAVRSIMLYAIGAFAQSGRSVTRSVPIERAGEVPAGVEVRTVGDALVWEEAGTLSAWTLETSHPEWSATIWARARTRLLSARGVDRQQVGALHLDPRAVVAFSTDALYLAGDAPAWADDGKPGRFRVKGRLDGAFDWPDSPGALYELRDRAGE